MPNLGMAFIYMEIRNIAITPVVERFAFTTGQVARFVFIWF